MTAEANGGFLEYHEPDSQYMPQQQNLDARSLETDIVCCSYQHLDPRIVLFLPSSLGMALGQDPSCWVDWPDHRGFDLWRAHCQHLGAGMARGLHGPRLYRVDSDHL